MNSKEVVVSVFSTVFKIVVASGSNNVSLWTLFSLDVSNITGFVTGSKSDFSNEGFSPVIDSYSKLVTSYFEI